MTEKKETKKLKITISKLHLFQALTVILAVAMVASFALRPTGCFVAGTPEKVGSDTLGFINTYLLPPDAQANLISASSESGMYRLDIDIMGQTQPVYVSGDGKFLIPSAIDMTEDMSMLLEDSGDEPVQMDLSVIQPMVDEMNDDPEKVQIYFFYGEGCPHCATEKAWLDTIVEKYPEVELKMFETYNVEENWILYYALAQEYGVQAGGVPATFIGEQNWIGFADYIGDEMESYIVECIETGCPSPILKLK